MTTEKNPLGLAGIDFVEFAGGTHADMIQTFIDFGFSRTKTHRTKNIDYFGQNDIHFFYNMDMKGFAADFARAHGPCIAAMGWRVADAESAFRTAIERGARPYEGSSDSKLVQAPTIYGIGDSLIYFVDRPAGQQHALIDDDFEPKSEPTLVADNGFVRIDHLTNNVYQGTMETWSNFYKDVFGFTEVRYFDIRGKKTGLTSYALQSPCETFCIPINEASDKKSQIQEYLDLYNGPGIQHIAFLSNDLLSSLEALQGNSIETLDISPDYYEQVFNRVPNVTEDRDRIKRLNVLVDGDEEGYLLQIFTKNLVGPIFIEMIQRKNHYSFGEGNFQALFDSIERDQERRGYL